MHFPTQDMESDYLKIWPNSLIVEMMMVPSTSLTGKDKADYYNTSIIKCNTL